MFVIESVQKENDVVLKNGQKVHVITRRLFEGDLRRHFIGEVKEVDGHLVLLEGYPIVFLSMYNQFIKKSHKNLRIFSLANTGLIINVLPDHVNLEELVYTNADRKLSLTDNKSFTLDIQEFTANR